MKSNILTISLLLLSTHSNASIILFEDFEDTSVHYTTSAPEFSDGSKDFFTQTDNSNIHPDIQYNNIQGNGYFAAMDIDGEGANLPLTMTFSGLNIFSFSDLSFSGLFAEDDDGNQQDWDTTDYFKAEYQIDNNGWSNLLAFESIPDGDNFNAVPAIDLDFDGNGDDQLLTDTFTQFNAAIGGVGNLLDIRFTFNLNAGEEDIALDNITISGNYNDPTISQSIPEPSTILLFGAGIFLLNFIRRSKTWASVQDCSR